MMSEPDPKADMDSQNSNEDTASQSSPLPEYATPGKTLRDEREALGLNRARVGQSLGLTETAVKNLESNTFDYFPGSVYVRGYLKNYAKLVGKEDEEIIALYDRYCVDHGLDDGNSQIMPPNGAGARSSKLKLMMGICLVVIIIASVFALIGKFA